MQENYQHKIGLPLHIKSRSKIIFGLVSVCFLGFSVSGAYAGIKTGKFNSVFIEPLKKFTASMETKQDFSNINTENTPYLNGSSSVNVDVKINSNGQGTQYDSSNSSMVYPTSVPTSIQSFSKTLEQIQQEQADWWAKVQARQQQLSEQSIKDLEQFKADSEKKMQEFEQQGQQGIEDFQKENEQKMQEFKDKYGIQ